MANVVKYKHQVWGEPITGERLSTNGYYTGEHLGTVMQDAAVDGTELPHAVEEGIIRYGTIMQDAIEGITPDVDSGRTEIYTTTVTGRTGANVTLPGFNLSTYTDKTLIAKVNDIESEPQVITLSGEGIYKLSVDGDLIISMSVTETEAYLKNSSDEVEYTITIYQV